MIACESFHHFYKGCILRTKRTCPSGDKKYYHREVFTVIELIGLPFPRRFRQGKTKRT